MKVTKESSSNTESIFNVDYANFKEDSAFLDKQIHRVIEYKLLITKRRDLIFFSRILLVSILNSLYYCLILSMDEEIELVTAKVFQSIVILILTLGEFFLLGTATSYVISKRENEGYKPFTDKRFLVEEEGAVEVSLAKYDDIDLKETYFYNVIYGMLLFTSEILLYYFLSLSSSYGVNIGSMYSLTVTEYLIVLMRLPYFGVKLGAFQYIGILLTLTLLSVFYVLFIPAYNIIVVIFTGVTVSLFRFIRLCIFEYYHEKTHNAAKLIRESSYVDGIIGLMLLLFIIMSKSSDLLIQDLTNFIKVILASFFYFFALKLMLYKEKHYYLYVIYSSLNFIFITLFDFVINGRGFTSLQISLTCLLSFSSITCFIHPSVFKNSEEEEKTKM